jgi:hypothetical protein
MKSVRLLSIVLVASLESVFASEWKRIPIPTDPAQAALLKCETIADDSFAQWVKEQEAAITQKIGTSEYRGRIGLLYADLDNAKMKWRNSERRQFITRCMKKMGWEK